MSGIDFADQSDAYRFLKGPTWVSPEELAAQNPAHSVYIDVVDENRDLLAYFAVWSWLRWVASGSRMLRVAHVDAENGIITMESA